MPSLVCSEGKRQTDQDLNTFVEEDASFILSGMDDMMREAKLHALPAQRLASKG